MPPGYLLPPFKSQSSETPALSLLVSLTDIWSEYIKAPLPAEGVDQPLFVKGVERTNSFHSDQARRSPMAPSTLAFGAPTLTALITRRCEGKRKLRSVLTTKRTTRLRTRKRTYCLITT